MTMQQVTDLHCQNALCICNFLRIISNNNRQIQRNTNQQKAQRRLLLQQQSTINLLWQRTPQLNTQYTKCLGMPTYKQMKTFTQNYYLILVLSIFQSVLLKRQLHVKQNYFEIIFKLSVFYFTRNHCRWLHVTTSETAIKLFQLLNEF